MDYGFDVLGWGHVIHEIAPETGPSQRLAERLGARKLGRARLPPPGRNVVVDRWGQSGVEWRVSSNREV